VDKDQARAFLERKQDLGEIKLRPRSIRFLRQAGE